VSGNLLRCAMEGECTPVVAETSNTQRLFWRRYTPASRTKLAGLCG
jgi:hypothetical protein